MTRSFSLRAVVAAAAVVATLAGCADATGPALPRSGPPDALEIAWSGFAAGSTTIRLAGGRLVYTYVPWDYRPGVPVDTAIVTPDSARWADFWQTARAVGLWSWPRECVNPDVVDGGGMGVTIVHDGRRLALSNTNASPGPFGRCDRGGMTEAESAFRAAVATLVGLPFPGRTRQATELPREGAPRALRIAAGRFPARMDVVTLEGDALWVVRRGGEPGSGSADSVRVVPTAAGWRAFWDAAERAGLVRWPRECIDPRLADGTAYELDLAVDGGRLQVVAANAWPQPDGRCARASDAGAGSGASAALDGVLAAVGVLIGRPFP